MTHAVVTLKGTYLALDGEPDRGYVYIRATADPILDSGANVFTGTQKVKLDLAGHFSVDLPATDDPNLSPSGFGYVFWYELAGGGRSPFTFFALPTGSGPVDVSSITPTTPADFASTGLYVAEPSAPVNGHTLVWSSTAGRYVDAAPAGAVLKAAAKNITGTVTSVSAAAGVGTAVAIPGTAISVPGTDGLALILKWGASINQTVAGAGVAMIGLQETTAGSGNPVLRSSFSRLPNTIAVPEAYFTVPTHEFEIAAFTTTRTFQLLAQLWSPAANNPGANVLNTSDNPTFLRAVTGV